MAGEHLVEFMFDDLQTVEIIYEVLKPSQESLTLTVTEGNIGEDNTKVYGVSCGQDNDETIETECLIIFAVGSLKQKYSRDQAIQAVPRTSKLEENITN